MDNFENVKIVKYSDFGAVGDGVTDDFDAIVAAHEYANAHSLRVEADKDATYYIGAQRKTAIVKTDVDWGNAHFIIDDTNVPREDAGFWVFSIRPEGSSFNVDLPDNYSLKRSDTNIGLTFENGVLLLIENRNRRVYIRTGATLANSGATQREIILVDKNGNINPDTPLIFDYEPVTHMTAYPVDDEPLLIQGGVFTTYANAGGDARKWCGYTRGIQVLRSNTTVRNVVHYIEKEPEITDEESKNSSCPYIGFFHASRTNNVVFDSCVMTCHRAYRHGTYDTLADLANGISWKNCSQTDALNRFSQGYWGVMASNYVKNLAFDGCALTRFDAHCGVHNVTIKNSEIGEIINLVGSGKCHIENTSVTSGFWPFFIRLREDYGATWEGDLIIKNCKLCVQRSAASAYLLRSYWSEHYYGYNCYFPNLYVDGFSVEYLDGAPYEGRLSVFKNIADTDEDLRKNATNPLGVPEVISLKGMANSYEMMENPKNNVILADTKIIKD